MTSIKIEGVILQTLRFKDTDQILTLLTPKGVMKMIFKRALSTKGGRGALTTPLQVAEFVYTKGKGDLSTCREISVINYLLSLRNKLEFLESAGAMATAMLSFNQVEISMPLLYQLFVYYLENISLVKDPFLLVASLQLKILRHEGVLALEGSCASCGRQLAEVYLSLGECFCAEHAPEDPVRFTEEEAVMLMQCAYSRSMDQLGGMVSTPRFLYKVQSLFKRGFASD